MQPGIPVQRRGIPFHGAVAALDDKTLAGAVADELPAGLDVHIACDSVSTSKTPAVNECMLNSLRPDWPGGNAPNKEPSAPRFRQTQRDASGRPNLADLR